MKKTIFLSICIFVLGGLGVHAQTLKINPITQAELQQLKQQDGCGCYIYDANHVNSDTYLYGENELSDHDFGISTIHLRLNGKLQKFTLKGREFKLSMSSDGGGDFEYFFPKAPNDQDILKALKSNESWSDAGVLKDRTQKDTWLIGGEVAIYKSGDVEDYYLFTSGNYVMRLFVYKKQSGMEGEQTLGAAIISLKDNPWEAVQVFYVLECGC